jgi:hypothetical protein
MATLTVSDLAADLNTDARTTRKFLRSITPAESQPGKGSRWVIEGKQMVSLRSKFRKFEAAQAEAKAARDEVVLNPLTITDDASEDFQRAMREGEPTDADLEALDFDDADIDN